MNVIEKSPLSKTQQYISLHASNQHMLHPPQKVAEVTFVENLNAKLKCWLKTDLNQINI